MGSKFTAEEMAKADELVRQQAQEELIRAAVTFLKLTGNAPNQPATVRIAPGLTLFYDPEFIAMWQRCAAKPGQLSPFDLTRKDNLIH